ncbi:hypothetical protein AMK16_19005 [Streptomyces sp. CB00455]|uniref:serine/threonine-protein kinase n=1 Tax=Streptomyces sp. CB00455 TaxID=1703927 RepID=UPI00093BD0EE|nr:serine/threonine-protein kinase [Streptomyces sp. CB00455]OKK18400.1 hypothetical protein AMK16_19005 [Streptomyces sp. CB00455]
MEQLHPADPHRIGPYRLFSRLGAGRTGQVYLARCDRGRTVAVKLIHPALAARPEFRTRFRHDVDAARRLDGEWTAPVLDADTEAPTPWLATGYVAGPSLHEVVAGSGPLPPRSLRVLAAGLAYALQDLHRAGLLHGALHPSNVHLTLDGPRVTDLGITHPPSDRAAPPPLRALRALPAPPPARPPRTGEADPAGSPRSPGFAAPEQIGGGPLTAACDVFRLGAVLAYAATGRLPFGEAEPPGGPDALPHRVTTAAPDLDGVPAALHQLLRDCLRRDPAARPGTAEVLARVGARDTVADGRALEPWLPAPLVARLGRHAVRLLDREDAGPDRPAPPPTPLDPVHPARPTTHPTPRPAYPTNSTDSTDSTDSTSPKPAYSAYAPPRVPAPTAPPPRPRAASTAFLLAVAAVVAVTAGGTVYTVMTGAQDPLLPGGAPRTPTPATVPPAATATAATPAPGGIPESYLGTWQATAGARTWRLTLTPGATGDPVMSLAVQAPQLSCAWSAPLLDAPPGAVELGPSTVTSGAPAACMPGGRSRLRLLPDGTLQRELTGSGGPPLTYRRP